MQPVLLTMVLIMLMYYLSFLIIFYIGPQLDNIPPVQTGSFFLVSGINFGEDLGATKVELNDEDITDSCQPVEAFKVFVCVCGDNFGSAIRTLPLTVTIGTQPVTKYILFSNYKI